MSENHQSASSSSSSSSSASTSSNSVLDPVSSSSSNQTNINTSSPSPIKIGTNDHHQISNDNDQSSVCRVCRSDDPSLGPLFHPCRCTGSIAHVHQDCLSTWLSHSKKSTCELCGHLFSFEKVYKPGSPLRPPISTIIFQALKELVNLLLLIARATLVGVCWLGIVPWAVVWVSTAYWKAADWFAFGLTSNPAEDRSHDNSSSPNPSAPTIQSLSHRLFNQSSSDDDQTFLSSYYRNQNSSFITWTSTVLKTLDLDPNSIALDIFQGQLITCAIILSFVVVFLLREWILQNTPPPELIRDDEPQNELAEPPAPRPLPADPLPIPEPPQPLTPTQSYRSSSAPFPALQQAPSLTGASDHADLRTSSSPAHSSSSLSEYHPSVLIEDHLAGDDSVFNLSDLTDPGLGAPRQSDDSYGDHDQPGFFSHTVLVTSLYMLFLGDSSDNLLVGPKVCLEDAQDQAHSDASRTKVLDAWSILLNTTIAHPSGAIPVQVQRFREFIRSKPQNTHGDADSELWRRVEMDWSRQVLADPRLVKYLKSIYSSSESGDLSMRLVKENAWTYAMLSILGLIGEDEQNLDLKRLIETLEVLLFLPYEIECEPLGESLGGVIERFRLLEDEGRGSVHLFQDEIVEILAAQHILRPLLEDENFLGYSRAVTLDENLFTNLPLRCQAIYSSFITAGSLMANNIGMDSSESDLIEITRKIITLKSFQETKSQEYFGDVRARKLDWIDQVNFEHEVLVTSLYLILCGRDVKESSIPVLVNPSFKELVEGTQSSSILSENMYCAILKQWEKLATSCLSESCPEASELFRDYVMNDCPQKKRCSTSLTIDDEKTYHHFQRLEFDWLTKLVNDSSMSRMMLSILNKDREHDQDLEHLHEQSNEYTFFLIKLIYIYLVLEAGESPSQERASFGHPQKKIEIKDCREKFEFGFRILDRSLTQLESKDLITQTTRIKEVIRETRFLLESCKPLPSSENLVSQLNDSQALNQQTQRKEKDGEDGLDGLRYKLLSDRLKRGVIGVLVRQNVLNRVFKDQEFLRYANSMLFDKNLFSSSSNSNEDSSEHLIVPIESVSPLSSASKGKGKATEVDSDLDFVASSSLSVPYHTDDFSLVEDRNKSLELAKADAVSDPAASSLNPQATDDQVFPPVPQKEDSKPGHSKERYPQENINVGTVKPTRNHGRQRARSLQDGLNNLDMDVAHGVDLHRIRRDLFGREGTDRAINVGEQANPNPPAPEVFPAVPPPPPPPAALVGGDIFGIEEAGLNGDDDLMAEDIDGILELIGMKGSLLMLAQNVGLMTMLLSLSLLAFVHLPHMIGKIAILSRAHRILAPPLKGLLILRRFVHRGLDYVSDYVQSHLSKVEPETIFQNILAKVYPQRASLRFAHVSQSHQSWLVTSGWKLVDPVIQQTKGFISKAYGLQTFWNEISDRIGDRLHSIAYGSKPMDRALAVLLGYLELVFLSFLYLSSGLDQQRARFVSETIVNGMKQQFLILKVGMFIFVELVIFPFLCGLLLNLTTIPIFPNATLSNRLELYGSSPYSSTLITWLGGTCFMFTFAILVSTCRESLRAGVCWWIRDPSDDRFNPIREILDRPAWSQVKKILASAVMYGTVIVFGLGSVVFSLIFFTGSLPLRIHPNRPLSSSAFDLVIYQTCLPIFLEWFQPRSKLKKALQASSRYLARKLRLSCYLYGERRISEETTVEMTIYGLDGQSSNQERSEQENRPEGSPPTLSEASSSLVVASSAMATRSQGSSPKSQSQIVGKFSVSRRRKNAGGSFARVPATDSVKVVRGRKMHIPVRSDGTPIDPADMAIIEQQRAEAREEGGPDSDQYTVVYLPPNFKFRMSVYVLAMWSAAVFVGWQVIGVPLMVGRLLIDRIILSQREEPHDVYAYGAGMIVCSVLYAAGQRIYQVYREWRETRGDEGPLAENREFFSLTRSIFRALKDFSNLIAFLVSVGAIMPILSSVMVDLYVLGPIRPSKSSTGFPVLNLLESWSYGCIYLSIAARLVRITPNWISAAQDQVMTCWRTGRIVAGIEKCNRLIIFPVMIGIASSIALPSIIFAPIIIWIPEKVMKRMIGWVTTTTTTTTTSSHSSGGGTTVDGNGVLDGLNSKTVELTKVDCFYLILKTIYPMILSWYSHYLTTKVCFKGFNKWIEKVRDERFLEKRRLKNYDHPNHRRNNNLSSSSSSVPSSSSLRGGEQTELDREQEYWREVLKKASRNEIDEEGGEESMVNVGNDD